MFNSIVVSQALVKHGTAQTFSQTFTSRTNLNGAGNILEQSVHKHIRLHIYICTIEGTSIQIRATFAILFVEHILSHAILQFCYNKILK